MLSVVYTYDPLNRLTAADYSNGSYFHYSYDAVGNRLSETTLIGRTCYYYDIANRLTQVYTTSNTQPCPETPTGTAYTWDDNGNLLSDGGKTYTYDHANRLVSVIQDTNTTTFTYNGLGDRVSETINGVTTHFTLDLAGGLTQVLADGADTYLYGNGRIGQFTVSDTAYFLGDALGSVRQLVDENGAVTLAKAYEPYGEVMSSMGNGASSYGYTGEWDSINLLFLRARYYQPSHGRFLTRDTWEGEDKVPMSHMAWMYVYDNPILLSDPSGFAPITCQIYNGEEFCRDLPNITGYSEKTPPSGIVFDPATDPLKNGAIGLKRNMPRAQFIKGWDHKDDFNYGLCGQTSIAAILNSYGHSVSIHALLDRYYNQANAGNIPGSEARSFTGDDTLNYTGAQELANFVNLNMGPGHAVATKLDRYITYPDQWEAQWYFQNRNYGMKLYTLIKGWVTSRQYPITSVTINGRTSGRVGSGAGGHWVVITGISREFSKIEARSPLNWLRIYNPFDNATEYYWFPDFISNWIAVGQGNQGMVLMKPGPYYNIPFYDDNCGRQGKGSPLFTR